MTTNYNVAQGDGTIRDLDVLLPRRALFSSGIGWACGYQRFGALGNNVATITAQTSLTSVVSSTVWKQIAIGGAALPVGRVPQDHAAGIKADGTLWTWGVGFAGGLGNGGNSAQSSPVSVITSSPTSRFIQVSTGYAHTMAIGSDGSLWGCGYNTVGQLGDGTTSSRVSLVSVLNGGNQWVSVACGYLSTYGIKSDTSLWSWGQNSSGQLATGNLSSYLSPNSAILISGGLTNTNWKQVAGGKSHVAGIKSDGTLWTCGYNSDGELGDNTLVAKSSFVTTAGGGTTWKQVACGARHTAAVKTDGTLWTWGYNVFGQLGNGLSIASSSPGQIAGTNWSQVAAGSFNSAGIKSDGTLWTWGFNYFGQLGNGSAASPNSSIGTVFSPIQPNGSSSGTIWKQVSVASSTTLAITDTTPT